MMNKSNQISVLSADHPDPIRLFYQTRVYTDRKSSIPYVVYSANSPHEKADNRTALFLAGGGSSGVMFARVAQLCAEHGMTIYMLDLPGHTPSDMLDGHESAPIPPGPQWLEKLDTRARESIIDTVVDYCISRSQNGMIDIICHSAGFLDASNISRYFSRSIERFFILGSGIPGLKAMKSAYQAAQSVGSISNQSLLDILKTKSMDTGEPAIHFGQQKIPHERLEVLKSYQGREHLSVPLRLMREKSFGKEIWGSSKVTFIGSKGDLIASPDRINHAAKYLNSIGAETEVYIIDEDLPHMFMVFDTGAEYIRERIIPN
jgi:pimeloyl-ACP methyl ester carboxylesterase